MKNLFTIIVLLFVMASCNPGQFGNRTRYAKKKERKLEQRNSFISNWTPKGHKYNEKKEKRKKKASAKKMECNESAFIDLMHHSPKNQYTNNKK